MTEQPIRFLRLQGIARDWSKHNEHSRNIFSVHGFLRLSVITRTNLVSISRRREKKPSGYRHNTAAITPSSNSFLAGIFASEPITSLET